VTDRVDELMAMWRNELPAVLDPTTELSKRIMLLAAELNEATRRELPELGLTPAEFDVLAALRRVGPPYRMKPNELTKSLLLSSGGTSNVVNHLAAAGLVRREPDDDDGRGTWVTLTPDGSRLAEKALMVNSAAHAAVFADTPAETIKAATDTLRAVSTTRRKR
jgi:DNA-binding MarR family transcriptional regulator